MKTKTSICVQWISASCRFKLQLLQPMHELTTN